MLTQYGFKVKLAYRAQIAFELLRRGEPLDLIFCDIRMPDGMSGIELAQVMKSRFPTIPVLLATGYSDALADATAKGLRIIAKPYRTKELCSSVVGLLGRHKNQRRRALATERVLETKAVGGTRLRLLLSNCRRSGRKLNTVPPRRPADDAALIEPLVVA